MSINVKFPDGNEKQFSKEVTPLEIAESISNSLALQCLVAKVNDKIVDMDFKIKNNCTIELFKFGSEEGMQVFWHSSAHILAEAVKELFPKVKVAIGPSIEEGFYYDFEKDSAFSEKDLKKIEEKFMELVRRKVPFKREEVSRKEAYEIFKKADETYKLELLEDIPEDETVSLYSVGKFTDLCRGPHIPNTKKIKAVKILKTSGAYWRGDEENKMLQRIYAISFPSKKQLKLYLKDLEEREKRDHRKIGKQLDLFSIDDNIGSGLVLWHPKGAMIRSLIEDFWKKEHIKDGYSLVYTPHIGKANLWETSGHLQFYKDDMYAPMKVDGQDYYAKPMNCPFHISIYQSTKRSYRELPIKYAEMGTVYRYERSGALHGLMRVRGFTQDDAHIICTEEQVEKEVEKLIDFSLNMLREFGFNEFEIALSTKPKKSVGEKEKWDVATESLKKALEAKKIDYKIDEGGGAFYGPKIDVKIKDALNRSWQCSTVQFDFNLPERFDMSYIGSDNEKHRPFMIHRALLGSLERFFGTLIEYHGGDFPLWLAPVQVEVIPISDKYLHYADRIKNRLNSRGFRANVDNRTEKVGYKIRDAEINKIPFMAIVGSQEEDNNTVSIRQHKEGDLGEFSIKKFFDILEKNEERV